MTLLESIIAFVLLAVVGVACLDLARGATSLETSSVEWGRAVAVGESALAAAASGASQADAESGGARIDRRPWDREPGVDVVDVTVTLWSGATFHMSRLVRTSQANIPRAVR